MGTKVKTKPRRLTRAEARDRNRRALIDAALRLVTERGYEATQLDEVAAWAGLTKGAVYSIFGSKLDLLVAVLEDHLAAMQPLLAPPVVDAPCIEDVLERLADGFLGLIADPGARQLLMLELELSAIAVRTPRLADVVDAADRRRCTDLAERLAERPSRDGARLAGPEAAEQLSRVVFSVLQGLAIHAIFASWSPPRSLVLSLFDGAVANTTRRAG